MKVTESRLIRLEKRFKTLYQRFYATQMREERLTGHRRRLEQMRQAARSFSKWHRVMNRWGMIMGNIERGKVVPTLTKQEYIQLRALLKRQIPFKEKFGDSDIVCKKCFYSWRKRIKEPRICPRCQTYLNYEPVG